MQSGKARVTRPAPHLKAPETANSQQPIIFLLPAIISTLPKVPLLAFSGLSGKISFAFLLSRENLLIINIPPEML